MAASLSRGICSLVHLGSHLPRVVHYLLGPRRHLSVRASSDTAFLPAPTLLVSFVPAGLSQELPLWACPPASPVQILRGSPLFSSWGGAPRLCCSVDLTTGEGERTGTLSSDWDSAHPTCWAQGLALSGSGPAVLCSAPDFPGGELDYSLKSGTEMYFIVEVIITQLHIYSYYI